LSELLSVHTLVWCIWWHLQQRCLEEQVLTLCLPKQLKHRFFSMTKSLRAWLVVRTSQAKGVYEPLQKAQVRWSVELVRGGGLVLLLVLV